MPQHIRDTRVLWEKIVAQGELVVASVRKLWRAERRIDRVLFSWPREPIEDDKGRWISALVTYQPPESQPNRTAARDMVKRTRACAVLLVEQREKDVRILLESPHGSRCWTLPIRWQGDVRVLTKAAVVADTESLGALWNPKHLN